MSCCLNDIENEYARRDIKMMGDEWGKYFNLTGIRAVRSYKF
jgi:hypothetical protein